MKDSFLKTFWDLAIHPFLWGAIAGTALGLILVTLLTALITFLT